MLLEPITLGALKLHATLQPDVLSVDVDGPAMLGNYSMPTKELDKRGKLDPATQSVLLVCAGVGGEGVFLINQGFVDVTVSDLS